MPRLGLCRSWVAIAVAVGSMGCATGARPEPSPGLGGFPGVPADAVRAVNFYEDRPLDDLILPSDRHVYLAWRPGEPEEAPASPHPPTPENLLLRDLSGVAEAVVLDLETVESRVVALSSTRLRATAPGAQSIYTFAVGTVVEVLASRGTSPLIGDRRNVAIRGGVVRVKQATVVLGETSRLRPGARVIVALEPLSIVGRSELQSQGATHIAVPPAPYELGPPGFVIVPGSRDPIPLDRVRRRLRLQ